MRIKFHTFLCVIFLMWAIPGLAVAKPHVISLGKWTTVKWLAGADESKPLDLKVRALYVDTRLKEYTTGAPHEVTDRLFVVQRVFRLNDSLPDEVAGAPHWQWQTGGWLLVDRVTGRVTQITLPEFDPLYSCASWYRDYIAYCGVSDDGKKLFAMVVQLGRRKPILKRALGETAGADLPDAACSLPTWQRQPSRVTFQPRHGQAVVFSVRGRTIDLVNDEEDEEAESR
jgi:hypothetical protein